MRPRRSPSATRPSISQKRPSSAAASRGFAGLQKLADLGRGIDDFAGAANRLDHGHAKAALGARGAQQIGRAAAALAEGAVPADDDVRSADRADDDLGDEILGALCGKGEVEMLHEQQIDAEPRQLALLDAKRGQPERLRRRHEDAARMRLEGQHPSGRLPRPRQVAGPADQQRMAAMHPVEIAHRQHRAARVMRLGTGMSDDADHGVGRGSFLAHRVPRK